MPTDPEVLESAYTEDWTTTRQRVRNEGLSALQTDGDPEIVTLGAPIEFWIISWEVQKNGAPPVCPAPADLDPNLVFLDGTQGVAYPVPNASGVGKRWALAGQYRYVGKVSYGLDSPMPAGRVPWDQTPAIDNTVPASYFDQTLSPDPTEPETGR